MIGSDSRFSCFLHHNSRAQQAALIAGFAAHRCTVTSLPSAQHALQRIQRNRPDVLLLTWQAASLQVCRRLRIEGDPLPLIFLDSDSEEVDRVAALDAGADDFVAAHTSPRETWSRVHAVLRRSQRSRSQPSSDGEAHQIGQAVFRPSARTLTTPSGVVPLSSIDHGLLHELACNPWVAMTRERLLAASHLSHLPQHQRAVDITVLRLRRHVEPNPHLPRYLQTVRGVGYILVP